MVLILPVEAIFVRRAGRVVQQSRVQLVHMHAVWRGQPNAAHALLAHAAGVGVELAQAQARVRRVAQSLPLALLALLPSPSAQNQRRPANLFFHIVNDMHQNPIKPEQHEFGNYKDRAVSRD